MSHIFHAQASATWREKYEGIFDLVQAVISVLSQLGDHDKVSQPGNSFVKQIAQRTALAAMKVTDCMGAYFVYALLSF